VQQESFKDDAFLPTLQQSALPAGKQAAEDIGVLLQTKRLPIYGKKSP
jgi:hypothetical protein